MKNLKLRKYISCILIFATIISASITTVYAISPLQQYKVVDEPNLDDYIQHTIDFSTTTNSNIHMFATSNTSDQWMEHVNNVEVAKGYVKQLNLPDNGYYDLENRCIEKLDSFLSEDYKELGVMLTSFTVLEPKSTPSGMQLFGTVDGRDYYQTFVSRAAFNIKKTTFQSNKLEAWANGALNLALVWASTPISIAFSSVSLAANLGPSYQVLYDDEATVYFNVELTYREIYTENSIGNWGGNRDPYVMVYQDDKGTATPFVVYVSTERINGKFSHETQHNTINVQADHYDNKNTVLFRANNRYFDKHKGTPWIVSATQQVIKINLE